MSSGQSSRSVVVPAMLSPRCDVAGKSHDAIPRRPDSCCERSAGRMRKLFPGRATDLGFMRGANPESRFTKCVRFWIPGPAGRLLPTCATVSADVG
jgi:hypothetical protein